MVRAPDTANLARRGFGHPYFEPVQHTWTLAWLRLLMQLSKCPDTDLSKRGKILELEDGVSAVTLEVKYWKQPRVNRWTAAKSKALGYEASIWKIAFRDSRHCSQEEETAGYVRIRQQYTCSSASRPGARRAWRFRRAYIATHQQDRLAARSPVVASSVGRTADLIQVTQKICPRTSLKGSPGQSSLFACCVCGYGATEGASVPTTVRRDTRSIQHIAFVVLSIGLMINFVSHLVSGFQTLVAFKVAQSVAADLEARTAMACLLQPVIDGITHVLMTKAYSDMIHQVRYLVTPNAWSRTGCLRALESVDVADCITALPSRLLTICS